MAKPTAIVSDLHLGAVPVAVRDAFVRFTRHWQGNLDTLLINGDLFDFWFEYRTVVSNAHFHTLRALADLRESDVKIVLLGGNHDAWGGPFLRDTIGIELAHETLEREIAGRRAFVAHGDGLGPGDLGYKMLKRVLRNRAVRGAMRWVHPDFAGRIARGVSRTGDGTEERFQRARERAKILEEQAVKLLHERDDLDLVVFGHCHQPLLKAVGTRGYYVNSGDWVTHRTYTLVTPETIEQKEWVE